MIVTMIVKLSDEYILFVGHSHGRDALESVVCMNEYGTAACVVHSFELASGGDEILLYDVEYDAQWHERYQHIRVDDYGNNQCAQYNH